MSQAQFKAAIQDAVDASGALNTYIGGRLWFMEVPADWNANTLSNFPYMIFMIITYTTPPTMDNRFDFEAFVQFDLYDKRQAGSKTIGTNNDLLFDLFHHQSVTMTSHSGVEGYVEDNGTTVFEGDTIRITSEFSFRGTN